MSNTMQPRRHRAALVHGFVDRPTVWSRLAPLLANHLEAVAPSFPWGPAPAADQESKYLSEHLGGHLPEVVIGHSRGAYEVVREIADTGNCEPLALVLLGWSNQRATSELIPVENETELFNMCRQFILLRHQAEGRPEPSDARLSWLAQFAMKRFRQWDGQVRVDPEWLTFVKCPTLLLCGAEDHTVRSDELESLRRSLPAAQVEVLPGAGHWPMIEQPRIVAASILRFLERTC